MREVIQSHPEICSELLGGAKFLATLDPFMSKWTDSKVVFSAVHCSPLPILYIPCFLKALAAKLRKGRKALSIISGTVDRCTQKAVCLRLGSDGPASSRGDFLGITCVDFYAKISTLAQRWG